MTGPRGPSPGVELGPWRVREPPLTPAAVAGVGPVAAALLARARQPPVAARGLPVPGSGGPTLAVGGPSGPGWAGVWSSAPALVVLVGVDLPWVDGAQYLGRDPDAPGVLLPTRLQPGVAPDLWARRALGPFAAEQWPVAVVDGRMATAPREGPDRWLLVPLGGARPLGGAELAEALLALALRSPP